MAPLTAATSLREDLHAAVKVLLRRAQQAGAIRPELRIEDLFALLTGLMAVLVDATPDARERVAAVVVDGLQASR